MNIAKQQESMNVFLEDSTSQIVIEEQDEYNTTPIHPTKKIIVIDDDPVNLNAIQIALSNNYELTVFNSRKRIN